MRQDEGHFVQLQSALSLPIFVDHNQHITSATYRQHEKKVGKQNDAFHALFYFKGSSFYACIWNANKI